VSIATLALASTEKTLYRARPPLANLDVTARLRPGAIAIACWDAAWTSRPPDLRFGLDLLDVTLSARRRAPSSRSCQFDLPVFPKYAP
jgi:hypothetical protein